MSGAFLTVTICNVAICAAIAVGIYVTGSALPLFGLICLMSARRSPDCKCEGRHDG